jgi:hypothetical protein
MLYLVTVKLARNPAHNPRGKVTAYCPVGDEWCTDSTGEHHTFAVQTELSAEDVKMTYENQYHVTRVETAWNVKVL